jgi:hypothetical protein
MPHGTDGQFLCTAHVPAQRDSPERPLQTPRPDTPDSLPDPDAYFSSTLTEATTAPDGATRPLNVRILGWVMFPFTTSTMKLYVGSQSPRLVTKTRFHVPSKRVPAKAWREIKRSDLTFDATGAPECSRSRRSPGDAAALAARISSTGRDEGLILVARPFTKRFGNVPASSATCSGDVEVITIEFPSSAIGASPCEYSRKRRS